MEVVNINHVVNPTGEALALLRQAAELGPGYLGRRRSSSFGERRALSEELERLQAGPLPFLDADPKWVERRAKLFESGDYPDKGINVTERDLERLVSNFDLPVPILIEHAESPLELGYLTDVSAEGGELFGLLSLTKEANALIERSGAKSLSIGLNGELTHIQEVSLVRNPRVASAQLFSDSIRFDIQVEFGEDWRAKYDALLAAKQREEADREVADLVAKGQLIPAQVPFASALLAHGDVIQFDGDKVPMRDLVMKLLAAQPKHGMFGELAPQPGDQGSAANMLPEEAAFYRKHFPELSLESIAQRKRAH